MYDLTSIEKLDLQTYNCLQRIVGRGSFVFFFRMARTIIVLKNSHFG